MTKDIEMADDTSDFATPGALLHNGHLYGFLDEHPEGFDPDVYMILEDGSATVLRGGSHYDADWEGGSYLRDGGLHTSTFAVSGVGAPHLVPATASVFHEEPTDRIDRSGIAADGTLVMWASTNFVDYMNNVHTWVCNSFDTGWDSQNVQRPKVAYPVVAWEHDTPDILTNLVPIGDVR